ncbi:hypothetical protein DFH28DRAFT_1085186 [Melampsora americana]|nr:hypothetical protein DFH28DRAFT_1085186 [Melampsora americana]
MSSPTSSNSFECPAKIRNKSANEVCWLCNLFNSPMSTPATNPNRLIHTSTTTPPSLQSQLMTHCRKSHLDQAQCTINAVMQNKREALYLISNYLGSYLQSPDKKRKAAKYLCTQKLGEGFVNELDENIQWEWLNSQIAKMPKLTSNLCTP